MRDTAMSVRTTSLSMARPTVSSRAVSSENSRPLSLPPITTSLADGIRAGRGSGGTSDSGGSGRAWSSTVGSSTVECPTSPVPPVE